MADAATNAAAIAQLQADLAKLTEAAAPKDQLDVFYILWAGSLVFFMQAGFSMLESGCVGAKNVTNILFKNLMDACLGAIFFWLLGYGFAYGDANDNPFIGTSGFALVNADGSKPEDNYHTWFFQWAFAATAATIVSGAVAERCKIEAYFLYAIFLTTFVYPVVVHWGWDTEGWLCNWTSGTPVVEGSVNMIDFAGSGIVHMVGGFAGLAGAILMGPRKGRFETYIDPTSGKPVVLKAHNKLIAALGVAILWFGWYGFNCGSTLGLGKDMYATTGYGNLAARVAVTTTISAATAGVTTMIWKRIVTKEFDLMASLNGVLGGLVSITASCAVTTPEGAFAVGFVGALVFIFASWLLAKLKIDDPLDACPIHGFCGIWGVLSVAICGHQEYGGWTDRGAQFAAQLIGVLAILAWTLVMSFLMFFIIKVTVGLRVDEAIEIEGLDASEHGGSAYNLGDVEMGEDKSSNKVATGDAEPLK